LITWELTVIHYLAKGLLLTFIQVLLVLGPGLVLAYAMHRLSGLMRNYAARIFGLRVYIGLTALGIVIHELGHAFFCLVFRHKIVDMQLFRPGKDGSLGYVNHAYNPKSYYQSIGNFFIGTGPIWFGMAVIYMLSLYMLTPAAFEPMKEMGLGFDSLTLDAGIMAVMKEISKSVWAVFCSLFSMANLGDWTFYVFIYLVFCIGSHVTLSRSDVKGATQGFLTLITSLLVLNWLTMWLGEFSLKTCQWISQYYGIFYAVMLFALVLNVLVLAFLVLASLTGKLIQTKLKQRL
jgi:hypothetical protein